LLLDDPRPRSES